MLPQEIIRKKRNKEALSKEEIEFFVKGIKDKTIADVQVASFTMAAFLNGLTKEETCNLTLSMRDSGDVLKWKLNGPVIDKHSSGGVGDKISLMLAPIMASCGAYVPMISGRGLGHTGGTLDKLESIKGYNPYPDNNLFQKIVKETGCAIIGQTGNLAPVDGKIYAIRDVCATVESIPLITASILSKKLAAGLDYLVMDLKCGNGAFMTSYEDAKTLANTIVDVANNAGTKTKALLTNMNQVLGSTVGNSLEVLEAVSYLKGEPADSRLTEITNALCSQMLLISKLASTPQEAQEKINKSISSGTALEKFAQMSHMLGAPADFCNQPEKYLPKAKIIKPVFAKEEGYVSSMNTRNIGLSIISLKGGRTHPNQKLDLATGYTNFCQIGDYADKHQPLAFVHAQTQTDFEIAAKQLIENITISDKTPFADKCVYETV